MVIRSELQDTEERNDVKAENRRSWGKTERADSRRVRALADNATTSGFGRREQRGANFLITDCRPLIISMLDITTLEIISWVCIWLPSTSSNYGPAVGLSHSGCIHGQPDCTATLSTPVRPVSRPENCLIVLS